MDVTTIVAAAPFVKKAWRFTPTPLRIPLLVAGAAYIAWKYLANRDHPTAEEQATESSTKGSSN